MILDCGGLQRVHYGIKPNNKRILKTTIKDNDLPGLVQDLWTIVKLHINFVAPVAELKKNA